MNDERYERAPAPKPMAYPEHIQRLLRIHSYKRPHNTPTVDEFVDKFLLCYPDAYLLEDKSLGRLAVVIATSDTSRTMFSAHVDTVHHSHGRQTLSYDHEMGLLSKPQDAMNDRECLGADDGAGIWLLLEMIDANVPGTYVFHYGEERGGIGSSGIAELMPEWLKSFDRAIAFDRKGDGDVITHQGFSRCCSDDFARALADQLNSTGQRMSFKPDDGGVFTDTANYTEHIPECTNLSCGYEGAHTNGEMLDVEFLLRMREACVVVDWDSLPTMRDPTVKEKFSYALDDRWGSWYASDWKRGTTAPKKAKKRKHTTADDLLEMRFGELKEWLLATQVAEIADVIGELQDQYFDMQDDLIAANEELEYLRALQGRGEPDDEYLDVGLR